MKQGIDRSKKSTGFVPASTAQSATPSNRAFQAFEDNRPLAIQHRKIREAISSKSALLSERTPAIQRWPVTVNFSDGDESVVLSSISEFMDLFEQYRERDKNKLLDIWLALNSRLEDSDVSELDRQTLKSAIGLLKPLLFSEQGSADGSEEREKEKEYIPDEEKSKEVSSALSAISPATSPQLLPNNNSGMEEVEEICPLLTHFMSDFPAEGKRILGSPALLAYVTNADQQGVRYGGISDRGRSYMSGKAVFIAKKMLTIYDSADPFGAFLFEIKNALNTDVFKVSNYEDLKPRQAARKIAEAEAAHLTQLWDVYLESGDPALIKKVDEWYRKLKETGQEDRIEKERDTRIVVPHLKSRVKGTTLGGKKQEMTIWEDYSNQIEKSRRSEKKKEEK